MGSDARKNVDCRGQLDVRNWMTIYLFVNERNNSMRFRQAGRVTGRRKCRRTGRHANLVKRQVSERANVGGRE